MKSFKTGQMVFVVGRDFIVRSGQVEDCLDGSKRVVLNSQSWIECEFFETRIEALNNAKERCNYRLNAIVKSLDEW